MTTNIFFYILIPSLPLIKRITKKTKTALFIYYIMLLIFLILFGKNMFAKEETLFLSLLQTSGMVFFPLIYFFTINQNKNIINIIYTFLYYFLYPIALTTKIYTILKFGWSDKTFSEFLGLDFVLGLYIFGGILILLPMVILDKLQNKKIEL